MKLKNEEEIPPEVLRSFSFAGDHEESRLQLQSTAFVSLVTGCVLIQLLILHLCEAQG